MLIMVSDCFEAEREIVDKMRSVRCEEPLLHATIDTPLGVTIREEDNNECAKSRIRALEKKI